MKTLFARCLAVQAAVFPMVAAVAQLQRRLDMPGLRLTFIRTMP